MRRTSLFAVIVALLTFTAACPGAGSATVAATDAGQETISTVKPTENVTVTVTEVVDGDTVDIRYQNGSTDTVRLIGVDTPEAFSSVSPAEFGLSDSNRARVWLRSHAKNASQFVQNRLEEETVTIARDPNLSNRGSFDRLLRYLYHNDSLLNLDLLENGLARVYDSSFSERSRFEAAASRAQNANKGIWGFDETQSVSSSQVTIATLVADAPGDEYQNLPEERIGIENTGSETLDLAGWTLSDDDGHAYTFPPLTLAPGESVVVHTGDGSSTASDRYWGQDVPVWNNGGDRIVVRDATGSEVLNATYDDSEAITYHNTQMHESGVTQTLFDTVAGEDGSLSRADVLGLVQGYITQGKVDRTPVSREDVLILVEYYVRN